MPGVQPSRHPNHPPRHSLRAASVVLAVLASAALELARWSQAHEPRVAGLATALTAVLVLAAGAWLHRQSNENRLAAALAVLAIALLAMAPFATELVLRRFGSIGESPEFVQLVALRNFMLGLAAAAIWPGALRMCCALSLFVALGALMFLTNWPGYIAIGLYGVVGVFWLMGANWERMQGHFAADTQRGIPLTAGAGSIAGVFGTAAIAALSLGSTGSAVALAGWFWGSGGVGSTDPFAARGVGDGDQLVAAKDDAASFGAVESELFLDSEMPSLYDMFNDMYGEPLNKKNEQNRAIAIAARPESPQEQRTAQSLRSGREFSTVRRHIARAPQMLDDRDSQALIYVTGRVPLHMRLETFDAFDGRTWTHSPDAGTGCQVSLTIQNRAGKPWLSVQRPSESSALCQAESHILKIIRLATTRIPTPAHATGAHIDRVDQLDFYGWSEDDILWMPGRERIPPLQVIHLRSRSVDPGRLSAGQCQSAGSAHAVYLALLDREQSDAIAALAREWAADFPSGYPQVAAIVANLRGGQFALDSSATAPAECDDAASHFLFHSHRGPDYLFATSAALLLRSLGYPARVATGLYANDQHYDRLSRQTTVLSEDVHFWTETCLDGQSWITIEPTPGYDVLPPFRTWSEQLSMAVAEVARSLRQHPQYPLATVLVFGLAIGFRRELANLAFTFVWLVCRFRSLRMRVLTTLWLIEHRAALAGRRRPAHAPLANWYLPVARAASSQAADALDCLLLEASRLLYAPQGLAPSGNSGRQRLDAICRAAARTITLRRLRQIFAAAA